MPKHQLNMKNLIDICPSISVGKLTFAVYINVTCIYTRLFCPFYLVKGKDTILPKMNKSIQQ